MAPRAQADMPWPLLELNTACRSIMDGDWVETKDQGGSDYRLLQVSNIGLGTFRETGNFRYITQETFDRLRCTAIQPNHVLVSRMPDPVGRAWHARALAWPAVTAVDVAIVDPDPTQLDPSYLAYYLNSPRNLAYAAGRATGTTRLRITRRDLASFEIPLPPLPVQRKIAAVLSTYDDLIENNSHRIELLDEMAQRIYSQWFVDFRYPGHENVPLVGSELGPIPQGWRVSTLGDLCLRVLDGDWIETKDQSGDAYRLLQVSNIGRGVFRETGNYRYISQDTFAKLRCTEIKVGSVLVSRMPDPVGRAWYVDHLDGPAITAVDVAIVEPNPDAVDPQYCAFYLNTPRNLQYAAQRASGTTRLRITRRDLATFPIPVPPSDVRDAFGRTLKDNGKLSLALTFATRNLRDTRDLLLPRVISGEVDVADLDIAMPEATA